MKFSINSRVLLGQISAVGRVINPKSPIMILSCFLMELQGSALTVTGSDQENVMSCRIDVSGEEGEGRFCLDAKRTLDLLKAMPDGPVTFEVNEETLAVTIKFDKGRYEMVAADAGQYPASGIDPEGEGVEFSLPSDVLSAGIEKVSFAIGTDDFRPQMMGVFFDVKEDAVVFVATDTRRLAKYRNTKGQPGTECSFILSGKTVGILSGALAKDCAVRVAVTPNSVRFDGDRFSVSACRIRGNYPDYGRVIPKESAMSATIERGELVAALKRVSVCASAETGLVKLRFSPIDVVIKAQDISRSSSGMENVQCEFAGAGGAAIGFASAYLLDILGVIATQKVVMKMGGPDRPAIILPSENDEHGELTLLCMPMHINGD